MRPVRPGQCVGGCVRASPRSDRARGGERAAYAGFYEIDAGIGGQPYTVSKKGFGHAALVAGGAVNVFADADAAWFSVSVESILSVDPDAILLDADSMAAGQPVELVAQRPGFAALRAVKAHRTYVLQSAWIARPGPRVVLGVEQIARALHPNAMQILPISAELAALPLIDPNAKQR